MEMPKGDLVCIQADASRFHYDCAKRVYGEKEIETVWAHKINVARLCRWMDIVFDPQATQENGRPFTQLDRKSARQHYDSFTRDREGNVITAIYRDEWVRMKMECAAHEEEMMDSCGHCLLRIE